jgi:hypothetical protein
VANAGLFSGVPNYSVQISNTGSPVSGAVVKMDESGEVLSETAFGSGVYMTDGLSGFTAGATINLTILCSYGGLVVSGVVPALNAANNVVNIAQANAGSTFTLANSEAPTPVPTKAPIDLQVQAYVAYTNGSPADDTYGGVLIAHGGSPYSGAIVSMNGQPLPETTPGIYELDPLLGLAAGVTVNLHIFTSYGTVDESGVEPAYGLDNNIPLTYLNGGSVFDLSNNYY